LNGVFIWFDAFHRRIVQEVARSGFGWGGRFFALSIRPLEA
jgi:hypothetical protein